MFIGNIFQGNFATIIGIMKHCMLLDRFHGFSCSEAFIARRQNHGEIKILLLKFIFWIKFLAHSMFEKSHISEEYCNAEIMIVLQVPSKQYQRIAHDQHA